MVKLPRASARSSEKQISFYGEDLAHLHDEAFGDWARAAANVLLAHAPPGLVVDLGCGSGILAEELTAAGRPVLGIDLSPAMLRIAKERVPTGTFRKGSLLDAEIPPCAAVAIVGEGVNFLFDGADHDRRLRKLLKRIQAALAPGGLLLLDAAGPGRASRAGVRSWHEGKGWAVLTESIEAGGRLTRRIVTFRRDGRAWRRREETHVLRLLGPRGLAELLRAAGFEAKRLDGYGMLRLPKGHAAFVARKPSS
ncbi:MAG TPA: class I SAM-dependent methyltransferase [Candidatus Thermoplasmatota archaeon]|nr:class I SAM-dependent methyltransferase [Candidatus Thermoplasmatota archaeon]